MSPHPAHQRSHTLRHTADLTLADLLRWVKRGLRSLDAGSARASLGRIRGTGPGASFSSLIEEIASQYPVTLERPFENCASVAGGIWYDADVLSPEDPDALLTLRFDEDARDLPVHQHASSDRLIVVLEGRGFFHVTDESPESFTGKGVRTTAVRERDVIAFRRGVLHTFSTAQHGMTLLSFHQPYIPLEDEGQYTLPDYRWTAREELPLDSGSVVLESSWHQLI